MKLLDFICDDTMKGLFPLKSNAIYVENGEQKLHDYVYNKIFVKKESDYAFIQSPVGYALKDRMHLRKCLLLDPVANYYIYDFVYRNRKNYQISTLSRRRYFGYAFNKKVPINSFKDYHNFRNYKYSLKGKYKYFARVDIHNCFNSFYHHDVISSLATRISRQEADQFGQFLREGNAGISINCFPQGIYPAKTIGNSYLKFVEESRELGSRQIIRFLDDVFFFSNKCSTIEQDIIRVQQILGEHFLSLNEEKTLLGSDESDFEERKLDDIKISLLKKRELTMDYDEDKDKDIVSLDAEETEYLRSLIKKKNIAEEDLELAISLLKEDVEESLQVAELVLDKFPNMMKELYKLIPEVDDQGEIWGLIKSTLKVEIIPEFQLFWMARIIIDYYEFDSEAADLLIKIFNHPNSTSIVKAAILEVPQNDQGFLELKESHVRNDRGTITGACAISGLIQLEKAKRNQIYKYVAKTSPYMNLCCNICSGK